MGKAQVIKVALQTYGTKGSAWFRKQRIKLGNKWDINRHKKKEFKLAYERIKAEEKSTDRKARLRELEERRQQRTQQPKQSLFPYNKRQPGQPSWWAQRRDRAQWNRSIGQPGVMRRTADKAGDAKDAVRRMITGYDIMIVVMLYLYFFKAREYRADTVVNLLTHVAIFIGCWFFVLNREEKNWNTSIVMIFIILFEVFVPYIVYTQIQSLLNYAIVRDYLVNPELTMLWFYFAAFRSSGRTIISWLAKLGIFLLFLSIIVSFIMTGLTDAEASTAVTADQIRIADSIWKKTYDFSKLVATNADKVMRQGTGFFRERYRFAAGDYYSGTVDENQYETLGVYLKDLKPADPEFYYTEPVNVWALIEAKTLEDGLTVDLNCFYGKEDSPYLGKVEPKQITAIYDEEQVDVDCRFDNSAGMQDGSNKVTVQATFNFETMAYLKTYFMDQDRIRSMSRQGIDPLEEYGIEDKKPVAKYTNGPVKIGMGTIDPPIGISATSSVKPRVSVTVTTNEGWKGKIKQIEELTIMVPEPMTLDIGFCTEFEAVDKEEYKTTCAASYRNYKSKQFQDCKDQFTENSEIDTCLQKHCDEELEGYNAYRLKVEENKEHYRDIGYDNKDKLYKTFNCRALLGDANKLLGDVPISTKYYRAKARYKYEIEDTVNVNIKDIGEVITAPEIGDIDVTTIPKIHSKFGTEITAACNKISDTMPLTECYCYTASIITVESGGDPKAIGPTTKYGNAYGLMQLLHATANDMKELHKMDSYVWDEPADNIQAGVYYVDFLSKQSAIKSDKNLIAAAYNGGLDAPNPSNSCPGQLNYICLINKDWAETRKYVPKVMSFYESCENLDLQGYVKLADEKELKFTERQFDMKSGSGFLKMVRGSFYYPFNDQFSINVTNVTPKIVRLDFGKEKAHRIYSMEVPVDEGWEHNYKFPFFSYRIEEDTLYVKYWEPTVVNGLKLIQDEQILNSAQKKVDKLTPIWYDKETDPSIGYSVLIYAHFDGSYINLYDENQKKFCKLPWTDKLLYQDCEEDIPGIIIKNIDTDNRPTEGEPYATVQFIYDYTAEHFCCTDCSCVGDYDCETCKNCEFNSNDQCVSVKSSVTTGLGII